MFTQEEDALVEELAELIQQRRIKSYSPRLFNMVSTAWIPVVLLQRPFGFALTRKRAVRLASDIVLLGLRWFLSVDTIWVVKERIIRFTDDSERREALLAYLLARLRYPASGADFFTPKELQAIYSWIDFRKEDVSWWWE